jgi:hypothetical protein
LGKPPVDAGYDAVDAGERVNGAGDGLVEVLGRGSFVLACEVEFGAELVECDAGLESSACRLPMAWCSART